jgi:UDP-N-acetylmuramoyl-L-alanyl-D-glutamate--2,6-diaminopimelate ligase
MVLREILEGVETTDITGGTDININGISYDSRKIEKDYLFVAIRGEKADGHDFITDAVKNGATAVVREIGETRQLPGQGRAAISIIDVKNSRKALAYISNNFYLKPSHSLHVVGITGTNGKTTTSFIMKSILESWGKKTGLIGTIQHMIKNEVYNASFTTPEAPEFQHLLRRMHASGCTHVVSEISSHALALYRVDGTVIRTGVFTNLTSEHLDFHGTAEDYFMAKARLFTELLHSTAETVINYDDTWGRKLVNLLSKKTITFSLEAGADIVASEIDDSFDGLEFMVTVEDQKHYVRSRLMGLPNVYNILSAIGAAISLGVPWEAIIDGIQKTGKVRGRFEKVDVGQRFLAVIDYAHTEDALERLIYTARGLTKGRVIAVFGCGGDRDKSKRPRMGSIATRLSDSVIITSDNPRSEKREKIIEEIARGAVRRNYLIEPDREEAIRRAVMMASEGDIVLVAGKGHETYQEIKGKKFEFNDREVLEKEIRQQISRSS